MSKFETLLMSALLLVGVPNVAGCSSQQYDPIFWHQNFVAGIRNHVGWKLGDFLRGREYTTTTLSNGNVAYKIFHGGTCYYTFEVDPKTDIIVAASWEGESKHCIVIP